jgi:hypothetical protein
MVTHASFRSMTARHKHFFSVPAESTDKEIGALVYSWDAIKMRQPILMGSFSARDEYEHILK